MNDGKSTAGPDIGPIVGRVVRILTTIVRHAARLVWFAGRRAVRGRGNGAPADLGTTAAHEVEDALAELGPTFIKLGQVLSTRPDLVPPAFELALAELQDSAPAVPASAIRRSVRGALGADVSAAFVTFSDVPLAAASIGQVHVATLSGGRDVVVKVRRPDIEAVVDLDLAILGWIARVVSRLPGPLRALDVAGFVEEFGVTLRGELDYVAEGHNAERIRAELSRTELHVPGVVWSHTAPGVLTLDRIHGVKIDDVAALDSLGVDRQRVARVFADAYLSMVFVDGFYHADPHPGNLFVEVNGRVALVDFGMIGSVTPAVRRALVEILVGLATRDPQRSGKALRALRVVPSNVDEVRFASELGRLTSATVDVSVGELKLAPLLVQFMAASRRHRLRFPRELALLVKTVVMCEGVAAQLDPHFSLASALGPFVAASVGSESGADPPSQAS